MNRNTFKGIISLLVFCLFFSFNGLSNDFQKIINHVNKTPSNVTSSTSKLSSYLCKPYSTEKEKFAAIYYWIAKNILYDQELAAKPLYYENVDEIIVQVMSKKNGVCQHYAELFARLSKHAGLKAYVVNGYTQSKGKVDDLSHAWNIIKVGSKWYFIDATWAGSTTKASNNQFPDQYFMVTPEENIKSKMPFDPIWQALSGPLKYDDFDTGQVYTLKKGRYNYNDSIMDYMELTQVEQHKALVRRIKSNGTFNKLVKREYSLMQENYSMLLYNIEVIKYNQGTHHYNKGMHFYNQYARTKNNKNSYLKKRKTELISMIDSASINLTKAEELFNQIKTENSSEIGAFLKKNRGTINKIAELMSKERQYVENTFN